MSTTRYTVATAALHVSMGNAKTGKIPSVNKIPGAGFHYTKAGERICSVTGTCSASRPGCYAIRDFAIYRESVVKAWAENTLLSRELAAYRAAIVEWLQEHPAKEQGAPFRIHSAGDFESADELRMWADIAENEGARAGYRFYTYTHRHDLLREAATVRNADGTTRLQPFENLAVNISADSEHPAPADLAEIFPVFVWDMSGDYPAYHCPAVLAPANGSTRGKRNAAVTCATCRRCMSATPHTTAVHNH